MEGCGNGQSPEFYAGLVQMLLRGFYVRRLARHDDLFGAVDVGDTDSCLPSLQFSVQFLEIRHYGGHGSGSRRRLGHQFTPLPRDRNQVLQGCNRARTIQCTYLAIAVTGDGIGTNTQLIQQTEHGSAYCPDSRLCPMCLGQYFQLCLALFITECRYRIDDLVQIQFLVQLHSGRVVPNLSGIIKFGSKISAHIYILTALPWKHERRLGNFSSRAIVHLVGE